MVVGSVNCPEPGGDSTPLGFGDQFEVEISRTPHCDAEGWQLPMTVPSLHIERGEQAGRPIAFIVMSHRSTATLFHRQSRLSAIQSLQPALSHPRTV